MRSRKSIRTEGLPGLLLFAATAAFAQSDKLSEAEADKLFEDSAAIYRAGDAKTALANFDQLLAHYRSAGNRNKEGDVLYAEGWVFNGMGADAKALEAFTVSLAIQREIGDANGEALLLDSQGRTFVSLRQFPQAVEAFEQGRVISVRLGDRKAEAESLHNLGVLRSGGMNQLEEGLALLEQALKIRREIGDREGEASDLSNAADTLKRLSRPDESLAYYQQSLKLWQGLADTEEVENIQTEIAKLQASPPPKPPTAKQIEQSEKANDLNTECIALAQSGAMSKAQQRCERAVEIFRSIGNRGDESMALASLSFVFFAQSDYPKAMDAAQRSLLLARQIGYEEGQANPLNQMGLVYLAWGQYPQALSAFERELAIWRKVYDTGGERRTLGNIAGLRVILGQYEQARQIWDDLSSHSPDADTLLNIGSTYRATRDFSQALEYYDRALAIQRKTKSLLMRTTLFNMASAYAELGQFDKAAPLNEEALALDRQVGDRMSEGGALAMSGYLLFSQGKPDDALKTYEQALALAREIAFPTMESSVLAQMGELHEAQGRFEPALDSYQQSIRIEEALRAGGQSEEIKFGLSNRSSEVYGRAVRLLAQLGRNGEAFDLAERARARTFLDQLGNARIEVTPGRGADSVTRERELRLQFLSIEHLLQAERTKPRAQQDAARIGSLTEQLERKRTEYGDELVRLKAANPEYASLVSIAPLKLAEVQRLVDADTTLVSYFVTPGETLAFVVTRDALAVVRIPVSRRDLEAAIGEFLTFPDPAGPPPASLGRLSSWLIAPLSANLKTPFLGVIPHGQLHLLPFAALNAGAGSVVDSYTVFYLPSASALPFIQQKRKPLAGTALVMAQGRAQGLPPLKFAEQEAEAVAALYGTRALSGGDATETALRTAAGTASVLHVAAHGQLNPVAPMFSRLVLAPDDTLDAARDGNLEVREIYALALDKASLVVLSACQTQLGAQNTGDDIVGLSRAFIYAGTPSVVASLWSVDDAATAALMTAFHKHLRAGQGKAEALREAQKETRARFPDPYHWASFVLTGDPR